MKKLLIPLLSLFILSSCTNKGDTTKKDNTIGIIGGADGPTDIYLNHPDSLAVEQKEKLHLLTSMVIESIEIKDNRFHTTLTKEDFERHNLDPSLHDDLIKQIDEVNANLEEYNTDAQALYDIWMKNSPKN